MAPVQSVHTCRWATPTLFLPWPLWFDAAEYEWSCTRGPLPRGIAKPATCTECDGWTAVGCRPGCSCDGDRHLGSVAP
jgi:hypothetical protein